MVLAIAFVIAPIHAKLISKWCSKALGFAQKGLNETLMQLISKELTTTATLQQGLKRLLGEGWKESIPNALEPLRKAVIKAKTNFFYVGFGAGRTAVRLRWLYQGVFWQPHEW